MTSALRSLVLCVLAALWAVAAGRAVLADISVEPEVESVRAGQPFWVAVTADAESVAELENWQYWPPAEAVDADLPEGLALGAIHWPLPPGEGKGTGPLTVLVEVKPAYDAFADVPYVITLKAFGTTDSLLLAPGNGQPRAEVKELFRAARAALPLPSPWPVKARVTGGWFDLEVLMGQEAARVGAARLIPAEAYLFDAAAEAKVELDETAVRILAPRMAHAPYVKEIRALLILEGKDGERLGAWEVDGWNAEAPPRDPLLATDVDQGSVSFGLAVLFALVGGMILNLMPCVFPVLSIKLFALVKAGVHSRARMRVDGLAYTGGILASFLIVAMALLLLRGVGEQIGWGFQLQSPGFVFALALIMTAVGLNLAGLYQIPSLAFGGRPTAGGDGAGAAFSTGILTTVMATPCTAPFMAPALGYALSQQPPVALSVFLALGAGMALPYLAISMIPALARAMPRLMPKSGPWMVKLQRFLAVPMFLTVGWLLWVLSLQVDRAALGIAIAALLVVALAAAVLPRLRPAAEGARRWIGVGGIAVVLVVGGLTMAELEGRAVPHRAGVVELDEVAFSRATLSKYRREGRPVFLNFTAAWCLTCLVQDRAVLSTARFRNFLADNGITYMVADWTNPNEEIAGMLESFGRTGIPFYVFYPPDPNKMPVPLPEVFTTDGVIAILRDSLGED